MLCYIYGIPVYSLKSFPLSGSYWVLAHGCKCQLLALWWAEMENQALRSGSLCWSLCRRCFATSHCPTLGFSRMSIRVAHVCGLAWFFFHKSNPFMRHSSVPSALYCFSTPLIMFSGTLRWCVMDFHFDEISGARSCSSPRSSGEYWKLSRPGLHL